MTGRHRRLLGAFSPDGNLLAVSWETEPTITLWNRTTEEAVDLHPLGSTWVAEVKFSTDGSLLVFGAGNNNDSWVEVWSIADRQRVSSFGPTWGPPDIGSSGLVSYTLRPER